MTDNTNYVQVIRQQASIIDKLRSINVELIDEGKKQEIELEYLCLRIKNLENEVASLRVERTKILSNL